MVLGRFVQRIVRYLFEESARAPAPAQAQIPQMLRDGRQ